MGRTAAKMLHRQLTGTPLRERHVVVRPEGVNAQASTRHSSIMNTYILRARYFIR
ncbi:hypothetical protein D3C76_1779460 [compost metagenome]